MSNRFGALSIGRSDSKFYKGGAPEKYKIAENAKKFGGFSREKINKTLREAGYKEGGREKIIRNISGEDKKKGLSQEMIRRRNIFESRRSFEANQAAGEVKKDRYSFGGKIGAERVLGWAGGGVKGTATSRFGLGDDSSGFASQKFNNSISPSSPPSSRPGGGIRPGF